MLRSRSSSAVSTSNSSSFGSSVRLYDPITSPERLKMIPRKLKRKKMVRRKLKSISTSSSSSSISPVRHYNLRTRPKRSEITSTELKRKRKVPRKLKSPEKKISTGLKPTKMKMTIISTGLKPNKKKMTIVSTRLKPIKKKKRAPARVNRKKQVKVNKQCRQTECVKEQKTIPGHHSLEAKMLLTNNKSLKQNETVGASSLKEDNTSMSQMTSVEDPRKCTKLPFVYVKKPTEDLLTNMEIDCPKGEGLRHFYTTKIEEMELAVAQKSRNVQLLQDQNNELNAKVRTTREELVLLNEKSSYVGEVIKIIDKKKALVKVHPEGKFVVDIDKNIDINDVTPNCRVALRYDNYILHKILPNKVDPPVSSMLAKKVPDSTYEMVGGLDKQIKEIKEVIELPVEHPELSDGLGIAQPKRVSLYGPPGAGKTLLTGAECSIIRTPGSELVRKFIGEGTHVVRELFLMACEYTLSIIFMDEIESGSGENSDVQSTMLELLNQLDGVEARKNIKIIKVTNRIDNLDSALLRSGHIDRKIEFPLPSEEARLDLLKSHSRKMNLTRGVNLRKIIELMPGASDAEIKGVCTETGMYALRERRVHVIQEDFEMAVLKVMEKIQKRT